MNRIEFHPARLIRIDKGEWLKIDKSLSCLLVVLNANPNVFVSYEKIYRRVWRIMDEPNETSILRVTRARLVNALSGLRPDLDWENIIRTDKRDGYGLFLPGNELQEGANPIS